MSANEMRVDKVPGIDIVQQILASIDSEVSVVAAADDFDQEKYLLNLSLHGRKGRAVFQYNLLHDVRDNTQPSESQYTREKHAQVALTLQEAVEKMGRTL